MANKRVNDLPEETDPAADDVFLIDGATARKVKRENALKENLEAIRGLTSAADKGIQFTGAGTAATYDLTAAGKALLDDADAAAQRSTLGLVIGTDVQAYDADLAAFAAKTAPTGAVVGTTDTQTLTNKTLTSPVINGMTGSLDGSVTAVTQSGSDNSTKIATTAYVDAQVTGGVSGVSSLNGQTGTLALLVPPQGRLTVTSGVALPTSSVAAATTIYYTPTCGNTVPIYDGTNFLPNALAELSTALGSNWAANTNYDVFIADDTGTIRLATGPAWTTSAVPGNRGTGAATTELVAVRGILLNANSMTLRYNNTTTFSVSAQRATYVGTIRIAGSAGTVNWVYGALSAGGTAADFGVWNAYNRLPVHTQVSTSTDSWTYNVVAWRAPNGSSTYRASAVRGLDVDGVTAHYTALSAPGAATNATCGIGVNSTTANSGVNQSINSGNGPINARYAGLIGLGYAYVAPIEHNSTTTASSWYGDAATAFLQTGFTAEFWQ